VVDVFELGKSASQIDQGDPVWFNSATGLIKGVRRGLYRRRGD
jgi:hypothetical protein